MTGRGHTTPAQSLGKLGRVLDLSGKASHVGIGWLCYQCRDFDRRIYRWLRRDHDRAHVEGAGTARATTVIAALRFSRTQAFLIVHRVRYQVTRDDKEAEGSEKPKPLMPEKFHRAFAPVVKACLTVNRV